MQTLRAARVVLFLSFTVIGCAGIPPQPAALTMSPELRQLFQREMRELSGGVQTVAASLPSANWESITSAATAMRDSYVLERQLTTTQEAELEHLPDQFTALDQSFHLRAEKLVHAANAKDAEAVSVQFLRLLEICVACHSSYARARFPNFDSR